MLQVKAINNSVGVPDFKLAGGILPLRSAAYYDAVEPERLMLWCHKNARYGIPTIELVDWLRDEIGGRRAIEIGSGSGDLAFHLGIPATDSRLQEEPEIRAYYQRMGQPLIQYPAFVEKLDAAAAMRRYAPEVVIGSWITKWINPDLPMPPEGGSMYGVKEDEIVAQCDYILIGNVATHRGKSIMALPHKEFALPFLRSRAMDPTLNRVWVWRKADAAKREAPKGL